MIALGKRISRRIMRDGSDLVSRAKVDLSFRKVHGPARVAMGENEVGLVVMVKNAEWFLAEFLAHHQKLGVRHILVIDNGSGDRTDEIAASFANVTILQTLLPPRNLEHLLRSRAASRTFRGGWLLFADADELTEVPLCRSRPLTRLVSYLNDIGATAAVGHMIDFYDPDAVAVRTYAEAIAHCDSFSLEMIGQHDYFDPLLDFSYLLSLNSLIDPNLTLKSGGIRREVFGDNPFLSRHSLVRNDPKVITMSHPHAASGVRVADVTLLIRHYKFAGNWRARDAETVRQGTWSHGEDALRLDSGKSRIVARHPRKWRDVDELVDLGFLHVSANARRALAAEKPPSGAQVAGDLPG